LNTTSNSLLRALNGMAEVEHARLAAQNATRDEVKPFGQRV
jgi:predicted outer membrane protein